MKYKWLIKPKADHPEVTGVQAKIQDILAARGISGRDEMIEYLSDKPQLTYDPFLLKNMVKSVEVILRYIQQGKRICIYGDYDTDGVTAICLLLLFLGELTDNLIYYIPSRFEEGYGLNKEALKIIQERGAELVITVDCGSTSQAEVAYAKSIGLEIIVTDHHTIQDQVADCLVINPKQNGCMYPFKDLCGCGVAFKLAQAIQRKTDLSKSSINQLLDLVAIATIGDIVALLDENRTLVKHGLERINLGEREGILKLAAASGIVKAPLKSFQIAYILVPHLNAAGRMAVADTGVQLLTAKESLIINDAVSTLVDNNNARKKIQEEDYQKCIEIVRKMHEQDKFIIINAADTHEGIAGIVAGKIKDAYARPVAVVTNSLEDSVLKGTGRSVDGVNLYDLLKTHQHLLLKFGGHAGACGFLIEEKNLNALREGLNQSLANLYTSDPELFINKISIDAILSIQEITDDLLLQLEQMEPFGYKNEKPIFQIDQVRISSIFFMGDNKQHAKFTVANDQAVLDCILFNDANCYREELQFGRIISLVGCPDNNIWHGKTKIQFTVKDIKCYSNCDNQLMKGMEPVC